MSTPPRQIVRLFGPVFLGFIQFNDTPGPKMNFNLGSIFGGALVIPSVTFWAIAGLEIVSLILNVAGLAAQSPQTFYAGLSFIFLSGILCILHWRCAPRLLDRAPFVIALYDLFFGNQLCFKISHLIVSSAWRKNGR
jgi:hypothetical protein